jgi:hypothetical protein
MIKFTFRALCITLLTVLSSACTQLIVINPGIQTLGTATKSAHKVGLYISDQNLAFQVTTPTKGGDSVAYLPYRDLETPIYAMLQRSFADVARLNSLGDPLILKESLSLVAQPTVQTKSSSGIFGMWTPDEFEVTIKMSFIQPESGKEMFTASATGNGKASAGELLKDVAVAAKRASAEAVKKLSDQIEQMLASKK